MNTNLDFLGGYINLYKRILDEGLKNKQKEFEKLLDWYKKLLENDFEYEEYQGITFLVLAMPSYKRKGKKPNTTFMCMFCGQEHEHGLGNGHRIAQCGNAKTPVLEFIIAKDGTKLFQKDGYIIRIVD